MNKAILLLLLSCTLLPGVFSQSKTDFSHPDAVAKATPDSVEKSISALAGYFVTNLHTGQELIRAFYYWTANEIVYDVDNMFTFRPEDEPGKIITRTLLERKAVCQGYSELFHELCEFAGIESYVVAGYTKQNGNVVNINHAWVVARLDTSWYFFDPTWGSGFITNGKFIKKFTNEYFRVSPAIFIKSHMPFDPLWQCLNYPLNSRNFYQGTLPKTDTCRYFSFPDSIAAYEKSSKAEKCASALRRIEKNGVISNSVFEYQRYLQQSVEVERINRQNEIQNQQVTLFNEAINHYNTSTILFNDYIDYWNHQFKPARTDAVIAKMIDTCNYHLEQSRNILRKLVFKDETLTQNKEILVKAIRENQKHVDEQSAFLSDYFSTPRLFRGSLFRKYTWMGVPVK
jgi:transglutaminase/protease-like cytokinesis protein 3